MLIPGKSHSRVESRNSRVSIETLNFTRVRRPTFYWCDRSWIAGRDAKAGGGVIASQSPTLFPADEGTQSNDRHSGQWGAQNVAKRPGEGATGKARLGKHNDRSVLGQGAGESSPPSLSPHPRRTPLDNRST